jgi:hypothetical protein
MESHFVTLEITELVTKWDPTERAFVIPYMFYSGLMMAESRPEHVALM